MIILELLDDTFAAVKKGRKPKHDPDDVMTLNKI